MTLDAPNVYTDVKVSIRGEGLVLCKVEYRRTPSSEPGKYSRENLLDADMAKGGCCVRVYTEFLTVVCTVNAPQGIFRKELVC